MRQTREIGDRTVALWLEPHEQAPDDIWDFAAKLVKAGRYVGYVPHKEHSGVTTYRARLFVAPGPEHIMDYVGFTRDLNAVGGLLAYRGMLAESFVTRDEVLPDVHRALESVYRLHAATGNPRLLVNLGLLLAQSGLDKERAANLELLEAHLYELTGENAAMAHVLLASYRSESFVHYAQASLLAPGLPEAYLGMGMLATDQSEAIRHIEKGWYAADRRMDFWDWSPEDRFVLPALKIFRTYMDEGDWCSARDAVCRARPYANSARLRTADHTIEGVFEAKVAKTTLALPANGPITEPLRYTVQSLGGAVKNDDADVKIVHSPMATKGAWLCPLRTFEDTRAEWIEQIMQAEGIIAFSDFQVERFKRAYPFYPPGRIKKLPLGVAGGAPSTPRIEPRICVGDGSDLDVAQRIFTRVREKIPGAVMAHDAPARSHVWLYCGTDEPVVPADLLAAQADEAVPVVVGSGALPEYVAFGYIIRPPATTEAFVQAAADRIVQLLSDEGERLSVVRGGREAFMRMCWSNIAPQWIQALL